MSLMADPDGYALVGSGVDMLHGITQNAHLLWSKIHGRWVGCRELLVAMVLLVLNEILLASQCGASHIKSMRSFNGVSSKSRCRVAMTQQSGNDMAILCVGSILQWVLVFVVPATCLLAALQALCTVPGSTERADALAIWRHAIASWDSSRSTPSTLCLTDLDGSCSSCGSGGSSARKRPRCAASAVDAYGQSMASSHL